MTTDLGLSPPYSSQQKQHTQFSGLLLPPPPPPPIFRNPVRGPSESSSTELPKLGLPRAARAYCLNARSEKNSSPPPGQGLPHNPELPRGKQGGTTSEAGLGLTLAGAGPPSGPQASRSS